MRTAFCAATRLLPARSAASRTVVLAAPSSGSQGNYFGSGGEDARGHKSGKGAPNVSYRRC